MKMFVFISLTALHSILVKSIRCRYMLPTRSNLSLHSILVKSIRFDKLRERNQKELYIPFWLNLYEKPEYCRTMDEVTLHSILVKSIRRSAKAVSGFIMTLHSILVKSIPGKLRRPQRFNFFTFHSG